MLRIVCHFERPRFVGKKNNRGSADLPNPPAPVRISTFERVRTRALKRANGDDSANGNPPHAIVLIVPNRKETFFAIVARRSIAIDSVAENRLRRVSKVSRQRTTAVSVSIRRHECVDDQQKRRQEKARAYATT